MKIVIVAVIGIALVAVIVAATLFFIQEDDAINENTNISNTNDLVINGNTNTGTVVNTNDSQGNTNSGPNEGGNAGISEKNEGERILRLARTFVERYGTFSNRNNFENITTLEPYMSDALRIESAKVIDGGQDEGIEEEFYSIITEVVSTALENLDEGKTAVVRVGTRRTETRGTESPVIFSQHIQLNFIFVDGAWLVDSVNWE